MAVLETIELTKRFGNFTALNKVSMSVEEGEVYGFIGPNGAGKSTTIRLLLGMLRATSGQSTIFGMDAWKDAVEIHKRLAYVPGDVNLWPNLTGGEVIDLFTKLRGENVSNRRSEWLERFGLDPTKKCRTYSKGNSQKVALVAAFSSNADLFIFDEPTSGLDPLMEKVFQESVKELKREGKSIFLSSHILSEVERLCDKVAIIRQGEIIEAGTLDELRHLTRVHLVVQTREPLTALHTMQGVHQINQTGNSCSFQVDADAMEHVMATINTFGIVSLESAPPTLEDLFMRHYEGADS
ncbi:ABC transporter ATP-binding protein [Sporosarcina saromensis]|uniref:ABC transporter ATP-binding protein n=1 Tax=Sporosarcina saromensis TaxID=359365 RepID=A0ABU4GHB5_9BACL|nr:ABC transporter ATP-binding protein [Sporosarcina saromensis]MDW0114997.1 ABC transporter ATP-binding protein [Sporosarcina saromensis]